MSLVVVIKLGLKTKAKGLTPSLFFVMVARDTPATMRLWSSMALTNMLMTMWNLPIILKYALSVPNARDALWLIISKK
jgi:hypothetical protein